MAKIQIEESAIDSLKIMVQQLHDERDMLLRVVKLVADALPKNRDTVKTCYAVTNNMRDDAHAAIAACTESKVEE